MSPTACPSKANTFKSIFFPPHFSISYSDKAHILLLAEPEQPTHPRGRRTFSDGNKSRLMSRRTQCLVIS